MKKKLIKIMGLLICIFSLIIQTKAEKYTGRMELGSWTKVYLVKNNEYQEGRFILRDEDNAFLYCLQPFIEFDPANAKSYDVVKAEYAKVLNLTEEDWNRINLLAYYGYNYGSHTKAKWYTITQVMIWKTVDKNATFYFTDTLKGPRNDNLYVSEMSEIEDLIVEHNKTPNFDTSKSLSIGESITLNDTNNVLEKFSVAEHSENIDVRKEGDGLVITALESGDATIKLVNESNTYKVPTTIYVNDTLQNVFNRGSYNTITSMVNLNIVGGKINIHKIDDNGKELKGVKLGVYDDSGDEVCTIITDEFGNGSCSDLSLGTYTVKELETIEGYVKNNQVYTFNITKDNLNASLEIENKKITGFIELTKIDKDNNDTTPQGDSTLKGAIYGIYDSNGTKVDELITNEVGYAKSKELDYGKYTIRELKPSEGYILDDNEYEANINQDGVVIEVASKEQVLKFDFKLLKIESDGTSGVVKTEPNAVFNIFLKSKNTLIGTITTDDEGKAKITLPYGIYNVCQIKGSDEAELSPCFEINISNSDVDKTINNSLVKARLKVIKVDEEDNELPIADIRFKIKNLNTNEYVCQTVSYPVKEEYCEFKTNEEGILITPFPLEAGDYELEEVDQYIEGYLWNPETLKFSINANTSYDYDKELGYLIEVRFRNTVVKGMIEIYKLGENLVIKDNKYTYQDTLLSNITFGLYDELGNLIDEYTTDSNGYIKITNLKLGTYILKELKTNDNYVLDSKEYIIELKYVNQYTPVVSKTLTIKNYLKKGTLEFSKTDASTNTYLSNVKIEIYTENDELIFTGVTNQEGKITLDDLCLGRYYIIETIPVQGYLLTGEKKYFEIKENDEIVKVNMTNEKIKSKIKLHKVDEEGNSLVGVKFDLYNQEDEYLGTYVTDNEGNIELELEYGIYYFIETGTIPNYELNSDKQYFEVTKDGEVIELSVTNIKVPDTLIGIDYNIILGGILFVLKKKYFNS